MAKLPAEARFFDLSDYGRLPARWLAKRLKTTRWMPVHITAAFFVAGVAAVMMILAERDLWVFPLLLLKSTLDAADGELARVRNNPSYVGRYLDSIADFLLNGALMLAVWSVTAQSIEVALVSFACLEAQGTLYNYYSTILRHAYSGGDKTSRVFEQGQPRAFPGESQRIVGYIFALHRLLYGVFDKAVAALDRGAVEVKSFPWLFMSALSLYGLGFQLAIIGAMVTIGWKQYIIPFFIVYSALIVVFVLVRRRIIPV